MSDHLFLLLLFSKSHGHNTWKLYFPEAFLEVSHKENLRRDSKVGENLISRLLAAATGTF